MASKSDNNKEKTNYKAWGKSANLVMAVDENGETLPAGIYIKLDSDKHINEYFHRLYDGKTLKVDLDEQKQRRSVDQNNLYWLRVTASIPFWYEQGTPMTKKQIHQWHMARFMGVKPRIEIIAGVPVVVHAIEEDVIGVIPDWQDVLSELGCKSSRYSVQKFTYLLNKVEVFYAEQGYDLDGNYDRAKAFTKSKIYLDALQEKSQA